MKIAGLQPLSMIDFPGRIAAVLFTQGCGWRCPYCHNAALIPDEADGLLPESRVWDLFQIRPLLDGLVITGGEPTRQPDLLVFMANCKERGISVKLDSNGCHPEVLQDVIEEKLADYIAMDIKAPLDNYADLCGRGEMQERVAASIAILRAAKDIEVEFRTTYVPGLLNASDLLEIGTTVGSEIPYYIQEFIPANAAKPSLRNAEKVPGELFLSVQQTLRKAESVDCRLRVTGLPMTPVERN